MTPGPEPTTPEGYLIQLYERFTLFMEKYEEDRTEGKEKNRLICQRLDKHEAQIEKLNSLAKEQASFEEGKKSWWQAYKEPILIIFSLIIGSILTILLSLMGVHQ